MNLWLIPALPLAGFLINGLFGRRLSRKLVSAVAVASVALSFLWVLRTLSALAPLESPVTESYFTWIQSGALVAPFELMVDRLTAVMILVVTGVGLLIHVYSVGYMAHEPGYDRFFAFLNLFMFFMLTLVMAPNFLLMFVGWEGVGLCSYLLIGFYYQRHSATTAGNKAFIVNRIGDFGFTLAILLVFIHFGTLSFARVFERIGSGPDSISSAALTAIGLLLLAGATGKSAQVPLYVWLPDAMEGPTPVSALIHAATMVTAGVYMVARCAPIYQQAPLALEAVAWVGVITAFLAATIGMAQTDIKRVFAYSTVSQLGYMFLGTGCKAFAAGIYHLVTHAFFKALLFLAAGSVIHALAGEQDLRRMGGLRHHTPVTFATILCAALAISGIPPFSGFHSKDAILLAAYHHRPVFYWLGVLTAAMTGFYVFRAVFLAFLGQYRGHAHPHESPKVMTIPLVLLAALSLFGGYFDVPAWLEPLFPAHHSSHESWLVAVSVLAGLSGLALAWLFYVARPGLAGQLATRFNSLYRLVYNKFFVDEAYHAAIVRPVVRASDDLLWRTVDVGLIDGAVNGVGNWARNTGALFRMFQSGNIRSYAAWVVWGSILAVLAVAFSGGAR